MNYDLLISLAFLVIVIPWLIWEMLLSREARCIRELAKLNKIWDAFNMGVLTNEQARMEVNSREWRYHQEKIKLFRMALGLFEKADEGSPQEFKHSTF